MYSRLRCTVGLKDRLRLNSTRQCHASQTKKKEAFQNLSVGKTLHGFICADIEHIPEYNMTAYVLKHEGTKTQYLHLERDDSNNVFSVGFRTTPKDSMGTPHILEHTVLCGSEKFPVRDPFFKMLNRSLATFMNALTGPDYTFYPFSTQNEIDYKNLQKVYLDAVFKPNLLRLDFLQEGWRLEHEKLDDKSSDLLFKGVVFNEMKGVFSETSALFGQKFINTILPEGTYGYVSGGDPLCIPNLTHEHLKDFHMTHYHPSNARIFSYGNFPVEPTLKFINENYLKKVSFLDNKATIVKPQPRWASPKRAEITCRVDQFGGPVEKQNQIAIGYVMSDITDVYETFMLTALAELMIVGPNSAFYKSLIEENISGGYNSLTGYESQIRDTLFVIGLRDIEKRNFEYVEKKCSETIDALYKNGFDKDHVESVLHGFELSIKHQSPKFGLHLLFELMPLWNHDGPILEHLKVNTLLDRLKADLINPDFMKKAIEKHFIENKHKLLMTMQADSKFDEFINTAERKLLEKKVSNLKDKDLVVIYEDGLQLSEAQKKIQNIDILPCLKIEEITVHKTAPTLKHTVSGSIPLQLCEANTNGVVYFKGVLGVEHLSEDHRNILPFFNHILDKFDTKKHNYRDFDQHIAKTTSGLSAGVHITEHVGQPGQYEQGILIGSHCLSQNLTRMLDIWEEIFEKPSYANTERLQMLLNSYCSSLTAGVIDSGHTYAMQAARSLVSSVDISKENLLGMQHVLNMQNILNQPIEEVQGTVTSIANQLLTSHNLRTAFHYSDPVVITAIDKFCQKLSGQQDKEVNRINWIDNQEMSKTDRALHIYMNIPVHFCAKAIPTVTYTDPDYSKLRVLTRLLTSKYLHPIVREQNGAYGAGAVIATDGILNFYSYRDPNSVQTLDVFDCSADWLKDNTALITDQNLFESKLSILQHMDQPVAEYLKGIDLFLYGLSYDLWNSQRERILAVTRDDLIEVSEKYLKGSWSGKCVIGEGTPDLSGNPWTKISGPQQDK